MKINFDELNEKLGALTGTDLLMAERDCRTAGENFPTLSFSSGFQARLAARALNVNYHDLLALPLKDFNRVCQTVFNFLFNAGSESATT